MYVCRERETETEKERKTATDREMHVHVCAVCASVNRRKRLPVFLILRLRALRHNVWKFDAVWLYCHPEQPVLTLCLEGWQASLLQRGCGGLRGLIVCTIIEANHTIKASEVLVQTQNHAASNRSHLGAFCWGHIGGTRNGLELAADWCMQEHTPNIESLIRAI